MTENITEVKEATPILDIASKVVEKKKRPRKPKTPEFSDKDLAEFKEWKQKKADEELASVTCASADDDKVYRMWKEESRLVKGIFRCRQPDSGNVVFSFRKYKWDQTKRYTMFDGETYEVPLAVARHLNKNCSYAEHSHVLDSDGKPTINRGGKMKSRMNFESTEFSAA